MTIFPCEEIPIGKFFWIEDCIGFAENAKHGHGATSAMLKCWRHYTPNQTKCVRGKALNK